MIRFRLALRPWAALLAACLILQPTGLSAQEAVPTPDGQDAAGTFFGVGEAGGLEGEGLESAIEGSAYRLGPGDVLVVSVWGPQPRAYQLSVTLEGKVLIPSVGEVEVNALLLSEAKQVIRNAVLSTYRNVEVTVTLIRLRRFQIHVLGQVARPGNYSATGVERISNAIGRAGGLTADANQRHILVQNGDTLRTSADLLSFYQLGKVEDNPWLRDGDRVLVSYAKDRILVQGAVSEPGEIQFLEGDRLSTILQLAGGFTALSYLDTLEVARYHRYSAIPFNFYVLAGGGLMAADPAEADKLPAVMGTFSLPSIDLPIGLSPVYSDFLLEPNDIIFSRSVPESRARWLVELRGEVVYPGVYPIREGQTRLSDIVAAAGGLTPEAFIPQATLIRRQAVPLPDPEFERLAKMSSADMDPNEYAYYKVRSREVPGRMVVDFQKALVEQDPENDVFLYSGDVINVPTRKDFVSVLGTVWRPGNVGYQPGLSASQYVDKAGGYADDADKGKSRVIRNNGEWVKLGEAGELEPGDIVFVPEKPDRPFWPIFFQFLTVTYQIVAIYAIVDNATK